ncbi:MAG: FecR domain-containing protein [Lachnospiraceae bacterium]|nr:FecR domain-containing protein [Lachnospiraceae bacterium]
MNKKGLFIGGGAVALVALIVTLIFIFTGGEEAYRSIKVFEIDGSCKVERDGDTLDAFKNMALSSGDTLTVGDGSFTRLKLDDDKYVYLEANTKIKLTATGTANDSKTMVYIEHGSMLTEVKKKLSATSSYDIVTPNTTMSIRGTKTLTEVIKDVLGKIKTSAAVIEGHVKFATVQKDKNGKTKFVTNDLSVGQGLAIQTEEKDLVSDEDMKSFAETGATTDGTKVEETSHEELGSELGAATFSDDFLNNAADVLVRSAEEDKAEEKNGTNSTTGSDTNSGNGEGSDDSPKEGSTGTDTGVASTGVTEGTSGDAGASGLAALAVLNDMKDNGAAEVPADVSNYVEYVSSTYYSGNPAPVTSTPEPASDPVTTSQNETGTEEGVANGTDINTEDNNGEDGVTVGEESETEEERLAREEAERLEKEEAERKEKEEQEKKEREEAEKAEKERLEKEGSRASRERGAGKEGTRSSRKS